MPKPITPVAPKRIDPPSRNPDGAKAWDKLKGKDPSRKYVYVDPNNELLGVADYESAGFELERKREGGPKPLVGKTIGDGDVVTVMGQVLMSCPLDVWNEMYTAGQEHIDEIEQKIVKPGGMVDKFRGIGTGLSIENQTSRPITE